MRLKQLHFENFRGVRDATYELSDRTTIKGMNGSGKSTIASGFLWLIADRDYSLGANPPVRPVGAIDEVVTSVTADIDYNGKPVQLQKIQKLKRSKTGVVSLTNSYMVNSVPKSEKAFREYLEDLGFDFDKFLPCSHPGVLLAGINNKKDRTALRNMLFEMASNITDLDVAKDDDELVDIYELLTDYSAEEIEAIQNNTLRVIRENYGKEGEILRAKIEGLEAAKVEDNEQEHKDAITVLKENVNGIESILASLRSELADSKDSVNLINMRFAMQKMESDAVAAATKERNDFAFEIQRLSNTVTALGREIEYAKTRLQYDKDSLEEWEEKRQKNISVVEKKREEVYDEESAICPTCGQKLPAKARKKASLEFEYKKQATIKRFEEVIADQALQIATYKDRIKTTQKEIKDKIKSLSDAEKALKEMSDEYDALPAIPEPDMSNNAEYQAMASKIAEGQKKLDNIPAIENKIRDAEWDLKETMEKITAHKMALSKLEQNNVIDERIKSLRIDQMNYEQKKANAEKILHQLKTLNMKKNKMLQESVNKNFNLINWKLFDFRKNGETFDTCIPMIGNKAFGESMNTGLETMAKIDAINGIQRYFKLDYPIWLDNAEHLDSESLAKLETDHQLIVLKVTDDERLVIEND